jgi:hypothetical protein
LTLLVVDVEQAGPHLDAVAGQADQALDVVGLAVARQLEDDDIAAVGGLAQDPALEDRRAQRDGVARIAVGELRDDDVVALVEVGLHRRRRDGEGLEEQDAQEERDRQGVDHRLDDLDHLVGGARLADCLGLHVFAHN